MATPSRPWAPTIPRTKGQQVHLKLDRVDYWIAKGAKPTDTLHSIIKRARRGADRRSGEAAGREPLPEPRPGRQLRRHDHRKGGAMPRIDVLTLFPRMLDGFLAESILGKGLERRPPRRSRSTTCGPGRPTSTARPMTGPSAAARGW